MSVEAAREPVSGHFGFSDVVVIAAGAVSGAVGAYAYYSEPLRPLAHSFTLWIVLIVAVVPGMPRRRAVVRAVCALIAAVLVFYLGKAVMYGVKYAGMPYRIDLPTLVLWCGLAVAGGVVAGLLLDAVGRTDRRGTMATAAVVGLLVADLVRRSDRSGVGTLAVATAFAIAFVAWRGIRTPRQAARVALAALPMGLAGLVVVSAPDFFEGLSGSLSS
ncbi:hypothetical protein NQK81_13920 [Amycolatopsis roodepoortensis]|uniref:DUF6518 family protein n=1 Tax=Amycolatopsis roodepoortensis TaxID=700274 RepID=UPI00214B30E2|nr:DUF6518 family protein [Amycolatopsis roodepoortensis]UUV34491.1 hypothetical protein NQK81_13920 [Amycolatopsis roodepoortensis]